MAHSSYCSEEIPPSEVKQAYIICRILTSHTKQLLLWLIKEAWIFHRQYIQEYGRRFGNVQLYRRQDTRRPPSTRTQIETQCTSVFTHWAVSSDWVLVEVGVATISAPPSWPFPLGSAFISAGAGSMTWTMGIYSRSCRWPSAEILRGFPAPLRALQGRVDTGY